MVNPLSCQLFTELVCCGLTSMAAVSSCYKLLVAGGQKVVSHNDLWQVGKGGRNQLPWQYFQAWRLLSWIAFLSCLWNVCFCHRIKKKGYWDFLSHNYYYFFFTINFFFNLTILTFLFLWIFLRDLNSQFWKKKSQICGI